VTGDRYRFLAESANTGGRYALCHARAMPGVGPPPHRHSREEEAFFVLGGEITLQADGEQALGDPGAFGNLFRDTLHCFHNATQKEAPMLILLVAPAGLEAMFQHTGHVIDDAASPITPPGDEEKRRLVEIAPEYGIELHSPH